jgi:hypothetical protein
MSTIAAGLRDFKTFVILLALTQEGRGVRECGRAKDPSRFLLASHLCA